MPQIVFPTPPGLGEGASGISLPGTGTSIPRGIESIIEYNGLKMNDKSTIDKYRIISIDGIDDADVRDSREENPAEHGETAFDAYYGGRPIVLTGRIEAYTLKKLRDMHLALRWAFADLTEKPLYFRTGNAALDHYINCRKASKLVIGDEQTSQNNHFRDFQVALRASNPRFLLNQKETITMFPNLIVNPSFESDTLLSDPTNWLYEISGYTSIITRVENNWSSDGTKSFRMSGTKDNNTSLTAMTIQTPTGINGVPVLPNVTYTLFSKYNLVDIGTDTRIAIRWYDSTGTTISTSSHTEVSSVGVVRRSLSAISPSNAAFANVRLSIRSDIPLDTIHCYIDEVWLVQGNPTDPGIQEITNLGNFNSEPEIKMYGKLSNIKINNITTEKTFKLKPGKIINTNDIYTANAENKTMIDIDGNNVFGDLDDISQWLDISPGINYYSLDIDMLGSTNNSAVEISFRDSYL